MLQSRIRWNFIFSYYVYLELAADFELDQNTRNERKKVIEKYGTKSKEMQANNKIIRVWDYLNLIEIKNVLDSRG